MNTVLIICYLELVFYNFSQCVLHPPLPHWIETPASLSSDQKNCWSHVVSIISLVMRKMLSMRESHQRHLAWSGLSICQNSKIWNYSYALLDVFSNCFSVCKSNGSEQLLQAKQFFICNDTKDYKKQRTECWRQWLRRSTEEPTLKFLVWEK